jgi:hypothetical protein
MDLPIAALFVASSGNNMSIIRDSLSKPSACSLGLSATSQQCFSLRTNQPQPASSTLLSEQTSTSHQPPANRTGYMEPSIVPLIMLSKKQLVDY